VHVPGLGRQERHHHLLRALAIIEDHQLVGVPLYSTALRVIARAMPGVFEWADTQDAARRAALLEGSFLATGKAILANGRWVPKCPEAQQAAIAKKVGLSAEHLRSVRGSSTYRRLRKEAAGVERRFATEGHSAAVQYRRNSNGKSTVNFKLLAQRIIAAGDTQDARRAAFDALQKQATLGVPPSAATVAAFISATGLSRARTGRG
jgi:hypothetical protein